VAIRAVGLPKFRALKETGEKMEDSKSIPGGSPGGQNESPVPTDSRTQMSVIFDRRMTWRLHVETTVAKAFGTYIRPYSIFKSMRFNVNIRLIVFRALIRSITINACPTWEFAADSDLLKLQCLQNRILRPIGGLDRRTPVRDSLVEFKIPHVYDLFLWRYSPNLGLGLPP
jgi:hypothetical protein